ncbi:MAG: hypothetical protein HYZ53_28360 [Planctomycetes bacterium]|nr:hypothetical protein [Planctomycetota bacterium]
MPDPRLDPALVLASTRISLTANRPAAFVFAAAALLPLGLAGCDKDAGGGRREITEVRELSTPRPVPPREIPDAERFASSGHPSAAPAGPVESPQGSGIAWDLPPGWRQKPASAMRQGDFAIDARPAVDCYVSMLPGEAGGAAANINRWRKQMSLPPLEAAAVAALPRRKLLGQDAYYVEVAGTFGGMRGDRKDEGYKLAGAIAEARGVAIFVKMVGPAADVDAELPNLERLCATLRANVPAGAHAGGGAGVDVRPVAGGGGGGGGGGTGSAPPHAGAGSAEGGNLAWDVPEGWQRGPDRTMRLVTFVAAAAPEVECYLSLLPGAAGGVDANLNRWREQMGQPALKEAELSELPRLPVLGHPSPLLEVRGVFRGMGGGPKENYALLGLICDLGGQMLFAKMTGPADAVAAERERFKAFVRSLR